MLNTLRLSWSPIFPVLEERIASGDDILLIVVPYVKLGALQRLHSIIGPEKQIRIISCWTLPNLAGGASDLGVYPYLRDRNCELYAHPSIHLKLYVFRSNLALITSANLTASGLGYRQPGNVEIGTVAPLLAQDWRNLYALIGDSHRVDDELYNQMSECLRSLPQQPSITWPIVKLPQRKKYTIASLPAFETPNALRSYCFAGDETNYDPEEVRRAAHDLALFRVPSELKEVEFNDAVGAVFKTVPFVVDFVEFLKHQGTLRFGAVNNWIHEQCEDVPLPYKWEIKENTRILYNWLAHFFPEIDWDIPGAHSQVVYWHQSTNQESGFDPTAQLLATLQAQLAGVSNREQASEWQAVSIGGAPHQPILLLAVTKLYERHPERENLVVLDSELKELFLTYFNAIVQTDRPPSIPMPFVALRNEPFWQLIERSKAGSIPTHIRSQGVFDKYYEGARLDSDLHRLLASVPERQAIQETLFCAYFPESVRNKLRQFVLES